MPKNQPELGIKSPFRLRVGIETDSFKGLHYEADPGGIRDDEFQEFLNGRIMPGGKVIGRGGETKVNTSAMVGCVDGLVDDEFVPGAKVYWSDDVGGLGIDNNYIATYSTEQEPAIQAVGPQPNVGMPLFVHDSKVYCVVTGADAVFSSIVARNGFGVPTAVSEFTITGLTGLTGALSHGGDAYILRATGGVSTKMYRWDGTNPAVVDDDSSITQPSVESGAHIVSLNGDLYYLIEHATTGRIRKRTSAGVWSTHASFTSAFAGHLTTYNNRLYVFDTDFATSAVAADVYEVTGGGLTMVHSSALAEADYRATVVYDGYLYYLVTNGSTTYLGRFDGTTWNDTYKTLTPTSTTAHGLGIGAAGELCLVLQYGGTAHLWVSDGKDTSTLTEVTASFSLPSLLIFNRLLVL